MRENLVQMYILTRKLSQHSSGNHIIKYEIMNFECVLCIALAFLGETQAKFNSAQFRHQEQIMVMIHRKSSLGNLRQKQRNRETA